MAVDCASSWKKLWVLDLTTVPLESMLQGSAGTLQLMNDRVAGSQGLCILNGKLGSRKHR